MEHSEGRGKELQANNQKESAARIEVDFALKRGDGFFHLIQVCYLMDDPKTEGRELRALLSASEDLGCDRLTILNWDVEGTRVVDGHEVELVPLWKWLLYGIDE